MLKALKSISIVWIGMLLGAGLSFLSQVFLARILSLSEYGLFSAVNNFIVVIAPLAGLGVGNYWLKKYGQYGWGGKLWVRHSFRLLAVSIPLSVVVAILLGNSIWHESVARVLLLLLCPLIVMQAFSNAASSRFQLEERFGALAIWRLVPVLSRLTIIIIIYLMDYKLLALGIGLFASSTIISIVGYRLTWHLKSGNILLIGHGKRQKYEADADQLNRSILTKDVFIELAPFALGSFFGLIYLQSDIFLLSFLAGNEQAGLYNAAFAVMAAIYLLPAAIFNQYLLPKYHRWAEQDEGRMLSVFRFGNASMLLMGIVIMAAVMVFSPFVIPVIFGQNFIDTVGILTYLSLCIPLRFLSSSVGGCLVTKDNMKRKVYYQGLIAILNIILNFMLIPIYQAYGAILSTIISELTLMCTYLYGAQRYVFKASVLRGWNLKWKELSGK